MTDELSRDDLEATLAVRREVGPEIEADLVDALAEKVESAVQKRVSQELELHHERRQAKAGQLRLAITSLALGIPLTAIAADGAGLLGVLITWIGISIVNIIYGGYWPRKDHRN